MVDFVSFSGNLAVSFSIGTGLISVVVFIKNIPFLMLFYKMSSPRTKVFVSLTPYGAGLFGYTEV
jgi:hypothetical protein